VWARHKARHRLSDASARFEAAVEVWERTGRPEADGLEAYGGRLVVEVEQLHQAQQARQAFLVRHPEVPYRMAELDRAMADLVGQHQASRAAGEIGTLACMPGPQDQPDLI